MAKRLSEILVPITASTPEELSKKMFENNLNQSMWFNYSDPTFQDTFWITWFMKDIELELNLELPKPTLVEVK